jgi:biopolymer transport protein TolR
VNGAGFGRLAARDKAAAPFSDINVTPLVDVVLVLLVIFMISAPLMLGSLKLDLPKAEPRAGAASTAALQVAIDAQGQLYLGDAPLSAEQLRQRLAQAAQAQPHTEVQLRADQALAYGRVAELIALVQSAGLRRIAFVTEAPAR